MEQTPDPTSEPQKKDTALGCGKVIVLLTLAVVLIFSVNFLIQEFNRGSQPVGAPRTSFTLGCPVATYQQDAAPLVDQLVAKLGSTDLESRQDVTELRATARTLQRQAEQIRVPDCLVLKHETLVFTFIHTEAAMDAMLDGDENAAATSLSRATLNMDRFADWTVDVER